VLHDNIIDFTKSSPDLGQVNRQGTETALKRLNLSAITGEMFFTVCGETTTGEAAGAALLSAAEPTSPAKVHATEAARGINLTTPHSPRDLAARWRAETW